MVRTNRTVIKKAIFGISVVGMTAAAGVVGFAHAASQPKPAAVLAASNGYGGIGEQIRAAVEEFQRALVAATEKFQSDVANCVSLVGGNTAGLSAFRAGSASAVSDFSARTASPTAFSNVTKFDSNLAGAETTMSASLDADTNQLLASAVSTSQANRDAFRQCMRNARTDFHDAVRDAQRAFRNALRGIFS